MKYLNLVSKSLALFLTIENMWGNVLDVPAYTLLRHSATTVFQRAISFPETNFWNVNSVLLRLSKMLIFKG